LTTHLGVRLAGSDPLLPHAAGRYTGLQADTVS